MIEIPYGIMFGIRVGITKNFTGQPEFNNQNLFKCLKTRPMSLQTQESG